MSTPSACIAVAMAGVLLAGPADAKPPPSDWPAVASVHAALERHYDVQGHWPRNAKALRGFAERTGLGLDETQLSRWKISRPRRGVVLVEYELKRAPGQPGFFSISMQEIGP